MARRACPGWGCHIWFFSLFWHVEADSHVFWLLITLGVVAWLVAMVVGICAHRERSRHAFTGKLGVLAARVYGRVFHRTRFEGLEHLRAVDEARKKGRPIIIIANHIGGVDPLLVQTACPFFIRWIMADDMRLPFFEPILRVGRVLFVGMGGRDLSGLRSSLEHLKDGWSDEAGEAREMGEVYAGPSTAMGAGVIGLFPEGRLARKAGVISPFQPGAGLLISRSGALVLPVTVEGVPLFDYAYWSLITPSKARVRFYPPIDYTSPAPGSVALKPAAIVADLEARFMKLLHARVLTAEEVRQQTSGK
jgi:1-acyl-sn-glycerol-3-phosphate acyltransferase